MKLQQIKIYTATIEHARQIVRGNGGVIRELPEQDLRRRNDDNRYVVIYYSVKEPA